MTARTVLLASPYFPPDLGGVEQYVAGLARLLQTRHGMRVVVAATATRDCGPGLHEGPDGIPVHRLAAPFTVSQTPLGPHWVRDLRRVVAEEGVDLVNAHAPVPLFADAAARASGDLPFVLTYHTGRMRKGRPVADAVCAAYERTLLAGTVRRAGAVVCSSDFVAADLPRLFAGRSTTISPGVDLGRFTPRPLSGHPRILFAGSLARTAGYKGLPDLLRAVARLAPAVPDVTLDVAGAGSAAAEHEALAHRLGIGRRVAFLGRLDGDRLAAAYQRARVLALPTYCDSFPTVLVEAMACARPVVTTPVGGIPSLVADGEEGLLVPPGDGDALVAALRTVLTDDALARRLGSAGRDRVAGDLSWERQSDRTAEVFARAAHPAGRRPPGRRARSTGGLGRAAPRSRGAAR
ncbi:glycosyltransferase family 4 protein [Streptomyces sp. t39]|uniref:glycosyltransferase family 4 protein n=1 Tax=Streptomyces sp. t39 TaxID=1828156 RepID=UPI0011CE39E4|nr:glycosyltransferase family 4 protein [Streptomyces sp. t39]TXS42881.1 glycosyltransferase family 1 protein [Streptomyces sp. t39]